MMNVLAGMGLAGSAVLALWLLVSRLLKTRLPARWHYRILKTSLLFFLVPVGRILPLAGRALAALRPLPAAPVSVPSPAVPQIPVAVIPQAPAALPVVPAPAPVPAPESFAFSAEALRVLAAVWAIGAAGMLAYKACVYFRLRRRVFRQNRPVSSREAQLVFWSCKRQLGIRGPVDLRENPAAGSPFAAGLRRPTVVIPAAALEQEELRYLFLHELTHIKCGDLWVRFGAMLAQVLHWYNPLAYLLCRNIQTISEQSCDERVACPLTAEERYVYGGVIMKLAAGTAAGSGDWAASLSTRESIERRLIRVLRTEKLKGCKRLLALALAAAILACGGGAALAARNPLRVSEKEAAEPARTVPTVSAVPGEDAAKTGGTASAVTAYRQEEPKADGTDRPVTYNGTPSEAFLKELRAHFASVYPDSGVTESTPVLFGDHELILKRGGTLLPDENFDSYILSHGPLYGDGEVRISKCFVTKPPKALDTLRLGEEIREEYLVGNKAAYLAGISSAKYSQLDQLVNGEYPRNSKGETYGSSNPSLENYVGYAPDLECIGNFPHVNSPLGYVRMADELAMLGLPEEECPHKYSIPLYNAEGEVTGKWKDITCGGHPDPVLKMSAEEARTALVEKTVPTYDDPSANVLNLIRAAFKDQGATPETPVLFGNSELIRSRGGTILPDNDPASYRYEQGTLYKRFADKNGGHRAEYPVGNKNLIDSREIGLLNDLTPDGDYPKNSKGESYGPDNIADYVGYDPDMIYLAEYPYEGRPAGYIYARDVPGSQCKTPEEAAAYMREREKNPGPIVVPLYNSKGEVIGKYSFDAMAISPSTTGMSIEEAKAAVAAAKDTFSDAPTYDNPSEATLTKIRESFAWVDATANTPVLFGDKDLILSRGGTILPDNDPDSYGMNDSSIYKCFLDKNGMKQAEYLVGNKNALHPLDAGLLDSLTPDGDYPKNSRGESYGHITLAEYVGYQPDMEYLAEYPSGGRPAGYITSRSIPKWLAMNPGPIVPLYDSERNVIGEYNFGGGSSGGSSGLDTSGMSIEEAKAALEKSSQQANAKKVTAGDVTITVGSDGTPNPHATPFSDGTWVNYVDSALRGDAKLIRSVGGTVLADDAETSYMLINGYFFKMYLDKDGIQRTENELRNPKWIDQRYKWVLDTLVNGEYAKNSKGETYGITELVNYVGYYPDLGISFQDIEDTHTLPKDFSAYHRLTDEERTAMCSLVFDFSTMEEINARTAALLGGR